jgi:hypothetical protein
MLIMAGSRTPQEQCSLEACVGNLCGSGGLVHKHNRSVQIGDNGTYDGLEFLTTPGDVTI